jgi:signal recognition particle subunit SRP54
MVGLQGSGKTTTTAKLAKRLTEKNGKRILMASLDTNRPAAMEQLADPRQPDRRRYAADRQGRKLPSRSPRRAKQQATLGGYDVYMLDTAGRLHIDEVLMAEVQAVRDAVIPPRNASGGRWADRAGCRQRRHRI